MLSVGIDEILRFANAIYFDDQIMYMRDTDSQYSLLTCANQLHARCWDISANNLNAARIAIARYGRTVVAQRIWSFILMGEKDRRLDDHFISRIFDLAKVYCKIDDIAKTMVTLGYHVAALREGWNALERAARGKGRRPYTYIFTPKHCLHILSMCVMLLY